MAIRLFWQLNHIVVIKTYPIKFHCLFFHDLGNVNHLRNFLMFTTIWQFRMIYEDTKQFSQKQQLRNVLF